MFGVNYSGLPASGPGQARVTAAEGHATVRAPQNMKGKCILWADRKVVEEEDAKLVNLSRKSDGEEGIRPMYLHKRNPNPLLALPPNISSAT